jgi:hypothetical protein
VRGYNAELTPQVRTERGLDDTTLQVNQRLVEAHIDELYEEGDLFCDHGAYLGGSARAYVASGMPVVAFPKASGTTAWEIPIPVRRLWGRAVGLQLDILYTGTAASTANFSVIFAGYGAAAGSVNGAIADAFTTGVNLPGPAVANTLIAYTYRSAGKLFTPASKYIVPRIVHQGGVSANAGDFHVAAVHWKVFGQ